MDLKDWINTAILIVTIIAIVYGPIKAVSLTRAADEVREKKRRQYNILHSLMRTRAFILHADHVAALNVVQLEFYGNQKIDAAFRRYMEHLTLEAPTSGEGQIQVWLDERSDRFYTLVQAIAELLEFKFDKSDLKRLSYSPKGWDDSEALQRGIQTRILELLDFRRPLPIKEFFVSATNDKFPPPPTSVGGPPASPPPKS